MLKWHIKHSRFFKQEVETTQGEELLNALKQVKAIETECIALIKRDWEKRKEENRNMQIAIEKIMKLRGQNPPPQWFPQSL